MLRGKRLLLLARFFDHVLRHVDRHFRRYRYRDSVAGPTIDFDQLAVLADAQPGEIGVLTQLVDVNVLQVAAEVVDDGADQIMRHGAGPHDSLDAPVDAQRLEQADHDGKRAFPVDLVEHDNLLIVDLVDDDSLQFHQNGHGSLSFALITLPPKSFSAKGEQSEGFCGISGWFTGVSGRVRGRNLSRPSPRPTMNQRCSPPCIVARPRTKKNSLLDAKSPGAHLPVSLMGRIVG